MSTVSERIQVAEILVASANFVIAPRVVRIRCFYTAARIKYRNYIPLRVPAVKIRSAVIFETDDSRIIVYKLKYASLLYKPVFAVVYERYIDYILSRTVTAVKIWKRAGISTRLNKFLCSLHIFITLSHL